MAFSTDGYLFAVDGSHIEAKALLLLSAFTDVSDVMHFDLIWTVTDGTVIEQSGLGIFRSPGGDQVEISFATFGFLDLCQRLVEKVGWSATGFDVSDILAVLAEDFAHARPLFVGKRSDQ
jgi:hypothetical protein